MSTSSLQQPLSADAALEWLKNTLGDTESGQEWTDPDEALGAILECEWKSEDEFLAFFREISIQLARTATEDPEAETAMFFGAAVVSGLSLWSSYYKLWEKALKTDSPALKEDIGIQDWGSSIDPSIETMQLISLIPHAMAYEPTIFEALRNRTILDLTYFQEEFLGYVASSLLPGYYDAPLPVEIANIPSSRILGEIFDDWMMYQDLWKPDILREVLQSEHADQSVKAKIAQVLKEECDTDLETWEMHREEEWSDEDIEEILALCE